MRKQRVAAIGVLLIASLAASGCGAQGSGNDAPTDTPAQSSTESPAQESAESPTQDPAETPAQDSANLSVWFPGNLPEEMDLINDTLVPAFEAANPGVKVTVEFVPWGDLSTRLSTAFAGNTVPDVFGHGVAATAGFADAGRLASLDAYVDALDPADREDLVFLESGKVDGTQYAMPLRGFGYLLTYRTDAVTEAGLDPSVPPADWATLRQWADKLVVKDGERITRSGVIVPAETGTAMGQAFATFLYQAGGSFVSEDGKTVTWNSPEGIKALEFLAAIYTGDNPVGTGVGETFDAAGGQHPLCTGTAAMALITDETLKTIYSAAAECAEKLAVSQPMGDPQVASFGGSGNVLFVSEDSPSKDVAWKFVEFMVSPPNSKAYVQAVGGIPARASAAEDPEIAGLAYLAPFLEAAPYFKGNPNVPTWTQLRDELGKGLEEAFRGVTAPADALAKSAEAAGAIMTEGQ